MKRHLNALNCFALICAAFLVVKGVTTGLWYDEAYILQPVRGFLLGDAWRVAKHALGGSGLVFDPWVSTGPVLLLPAVVATLALGAVNPPILHLLSLAHAGVVLRFLPRGDARALFVIAITATPALAPTQFLGEFAGVAWFFAGLVLLSEGSVFASGVCLALGLLAKFVFLIPFVCVFVGILLTRPLRDSFKILAGTISPLLGWEIYQLWFVGGWTQYMETKIYFTQWLRVSGAGVGGGVKSVQHMGEDIVLWLRSGGVGAWAALLLTMLGFPRVAYQILRERRAGLFELGWLAVAPGLVWWVLFSQWGGPNASLRQGGIFAGLALALCLMQSWVSLLGAVLRLTLQKAKFPVRAVGAAACLAAVLVLGQQARRYLWEYKGYGPYTSWMEQRELARWIDVSSAEVTLLSCDPYLQGAARLHHDVEWPQMTLTKRGNFVTRPCGPVDAAAREVVVLGENAPPEIALHFTRVAQAGPRQSLWRR